MGGVIDKGRETKVPELLLPVAGAATVPFVELSEVFGFSSEVHIPTPRDTQPFRANGPPISPG